MRSITVEVYRAGDGEGFSKKTRYLIVVGRTAEPDAIEIGIDRSDVHRALWKLRYGTTSTEDAAKARALLGTTLGKFLPIHRLASEEPVQVDLVCNSDELWAVPFEATLGLDERPVFVDRTPPVVLTRRMRGEFRDRTFAWPTLPRLLFITGPVAVNLTRLLIAENRKGLVEALRPWTRNGLSDRLVEMSGPTVQEIQEACDDARVSGKPFTHIHVLAHGVEQKDPDFPLAAWWGLDLGATPLSPGDLVEALGPKDGLPAVVTLAVCDSGNPMNVYEPRKSFAHELHMAGVSLVLASQLPLQQSGTVVLTSEFYRDHFKGEDARVSLERMRRTLHESSDGGHDWLSVVAYVQLPEGYSDQLEEMSLRFELADLEATDAQANSTENTEHPDQELLAALAKGLRVRIDSLASRAARLRQEPHLNPVWQENQGLLGSAHKRLAQLLFAHSRLVSDTADKQRLIDESFRLLSEASTHYRSAFFKNPTNHWTGVQWMSTSGVVNGRIEPKWSWEFLFEQTRESAASVTEYWAWGTLVELYLISPLAGRDNALEEARAAVDGLVERTRTLDPGGFALKATKRQLMRYRDWWLKANGFFTGAETDLAHDAAALLSAFPQASTSS